MAPSDSSGPAARWTCSRHANHDDAVSAWTRPLAGSPLVLQRVTVMLSNCVSVTSGVRASRTSAVNAYVPILVDLPDTTPVDALSVRPGGWVPPAIRHA
jgi:hypothetical protein